MGDFLEDLIAGRNVPAHWGMNFTKTHTTPSPAIDPSKVTFPADYTVAVIGAGKGIGEYIAKAYTQAKASRILITARTATDLDRVKTELQSINKSVQIVAVTGDATDPASYVNIAKAVETEFAGRLDTLVYNAGGGNSKGFTERKVHEMDVELFAQVTTLNYLGTFYAAKYLVPFLLKGEGKTIVNITSGAAHMVDFPPTSYNVAKLAQTRLTEIMASTYKEDGIIAVAIHPGSVPTPGVKEKASEIVRFLKDDIGLCGAACVYMSKNRPEFLSGRYVAAAWDMEELQARKEEIVKEDKLRFKMVV